MLVQFLLLFLSLISLSNASISAPNESLAKKCVQFERLFSGSSKVKPPFDGQLAVRLFHLAAGAYANFYEEISSEGVIAKQVSCMKQSGLPPGEEWTHLGVQIVKCAGGTCSFFAIKSDDKKQLIFAFRGTNTYLQLFWQMYNGLHGGTQFPDPEQLPKGMAILLRSRGVVPDTAEEPIFWGKIHKYFAHAFYQIWPFVRDILEQHFLEYEVLFTGHSLGGALASLAAAQTRVERLKGAGQIGLYTFGQPRIGNFQFAMTHSRQIPNSYRIVHGEDGVVQMGPCQKKKLSNELRECFQERYKEQLPPDLMFCSGHESKFYHQGTEIWYSEEMSLEGSKQGRECRGIPRNEDIRCRAGQQFEGRKMFKYILDHQKYYGKWVATFGQHGCRRDWDWKWQATHNENAEIIEDQVLEEMHLGKEGRWMIRKIGSFMDGEQEEEEEKEGELGPGTESEGKEKQAKSWREWLLAYFRGRGGERKVGIN